jgi:purine-binding chemotaxis protein CheW
MKFDWTTIRDRLTRADAALTEDFARTAEDRKRLLRERARALAREPQSAVWAEPGQVIDVVEFVVSHERYAVEAAYVREVSPMKDITPLPGTPPFVVGIVNVRGQILSVLDLKKFFDLPSKGLPEIEKIVILDDGAMEFGLLVDVLAGRRRLPLAHLQPPLPTLTGIRQEYLRGVTADRLVVLDAARLLADPNIVVRHDSTA